jgi:AcrR family transcriptional regulator
LRAEAAADTRRNILEAAHRLFVEGGYEAMTMQEIADRAGVALDTVYEAVGKKPELARLLVETAISRSDRAVPAEEREYVQRVRAATDAREKLEIYARAVIEIHGRLAPLVRAVQAAAPRHPELGRMWKEINDRRASNMRLFAANLIETGQTRPELDRDRIADTLWVLAGADLYLPLVEQRGWSPAQVAAWLADAWIRMLLAPNVVGSARAKE